MNMIKITKILTLATMLAITSTAFAQKGLHITSASKTGWLWTVNDSLGFKWDINSNGTVNDGSNDAYDSGMSLAVGGSSFYHSSQGSVDKAGTEVEVGPWNWNNVVTVHRRIYIDKKEGYCRWIDIFENKTKKDQTIAIRYYSNMGDNVRSLFTTTGKNTVTAKDWGVITHFTDGGSTPQVIHFFATKNSKIKPSWRFNSGDQIYYNFNLKVPAGKTVALCFFEAQRRGQSPAQKFMQGFNIHRELAKIPTPLRKIIVNMPGATLMLGTLELPRDEKYDIAVLRNGDELRGKILNENFSIETSFGKLTLPASSVVGISAPTADEPYIRLGLADGQVVAGKLTSGPVIMHLASGGKMTLAPIKLKTAAFRLSAEKPMEINISKPTVILRNGQQVFFDGKNANGVFRTVHGDIKLMYTDISRIYLDTTDGGLHRVIFRNGSILSGLLGIDQMEFDLDLKLKLKIRRHLLSQFAFPGKLTPASNLTTLLLRNEDILIGKIVDEKLTLNTGSGEITLKPEQIASITFQAVPVGKVQIQLHKGTTLTGLLINEYLNLKITPGPTVKVFMGHIKSISIPKIAIKTPKIAPKVKKPDTPKNTKKIDQRKKIEELKRLKRLKMLEKIEKAKKNTN